MRGAALARMVWLFALSMPAVAANPPKPAAAPAPAQQITWQRVPVPGQSPLLVAIARPAQGRVRGAVLLLHGTHGFADQYVELAQDFARAGYLGVAACWFREGQGAGLRFVTPIACPADTPPLVDAASPDAQARLKALMAAVRRMPGGGRVALFGHSRGAGVVRTYLLGGGKAAAAILNSSGHPDATPDQVAPIRSRILIVHGEADGPADGGSPITAISRARRFEAALKSGGKPVETLYHPGGHNALFTDPALRARILPRMIDFLGGGVRQD